MLSVATVTCLLCLPKFICPAAAKSLQSCPTLCDPIDGSPPGSSVPGILQARLLQWVAIPSPSYHMAGCSCLLIQQMFGDTYFAQDTDKRFRR